MANFTQWLAAVDRGELRRITWVCGEQRTLVEEVVETTRARVGASVLNAVSLIGGVDTDADIWAQANQFPLEPGAPRFVLVREAQAVRHWLPLRHWLAATRTLPSVYLVFVSAEPEVPSVKADGKKNPAPHIDWMRAPKGHVVRCSTPNPDDAVTWLRRHATLTEDAARHLLTRVGGNLRAARTVATKLSLFPGVPAGPRAIDALVTELPGAGFVDALVALDRPGALRGLTGLNDAERLRSLSTLEQRLDLLATLHQHLRAGLTPRDIQGVPHFLVRLYWTYAKHYDVHRCAYRRRLLAVLDDAVRNGARTGVFEALVALW